MTRLAVQSGSTAWQRCLLTLGVILWIADAGCVSRQTYEKTKAEAESFSRTLEAERAEVQDLDQRIATLHALNKKDDAATAEIRAAIQREADAAPLVRQRAEEKLAALQTQVAHLVNQSRSLGREMAEAKQEGASLQAMVRQYKQELEEARSLPPSIGAPAAVPAPVPAPLPPPLSPTASSTMPPTSPSPSAATAQPASPTKPLPATRPAKTEPAPADDSWTGMIKSWVSTVWEWIFG
jgi:hypothetical protein